MGSRVVRHRFMLPGLVSESGTSGKGRWAVAMGTPEMTMVKATKKGFMNADMLDPCVNGLV